MSWGGPTWQDFLSKEVQESKSSDNNKSETLRILEETARICEKFWDSEKATEIRKDCEDVRLATISALKGVMWETSWRLAEMKYELDGPGVETLSDGEIDDSEIAEIREEFKEVQEWEKENYINEIFEIMEEKWLWLRYWAILNDFFSGNYNTNISIDFVEWIKSSLFQSWDIPGETLIKMREIIFQPSLIDEVLVAKSKEFWNNNIKRDNLSNLMWEFISENNITWGKNNVLAKWFQEYVWDNPQEVSYILFDVKNQLSSMCSWEMNIFFEALRFEYIESKNIAVTENLWNYFRNQDIPEEKQSEYEAIVTQLEENGKLREFAEELKKWGCSIDYIDKLKAFNEEHFWDLWIDFSFSSEDAQSILGSVIEAKEAEVLVDTLGIHDQIVQLTGISSEELKTASEGKDPAIAIWILLAAHYDKHPELKKLEWQLFEQLDIKRDIQRQKITTEEIIKHAPAIYDMDEKEREELKSLLMNTPPEKINWILAEKIDEITQRPENNPYIPLRLEEQEKYKEVIAQIGFTPQEVSTLTVEELQRISTNETMKDNFIHMKNTLKENNLDQLFLFRHQIFRAIWSLDFNIMDWNYIWENELNIFLSRVAYATMWEKRLQSTPSNIDTTLNIIRWINDPDSFSGVEDISSVWIGWGYIETEFRKKFAPKDAWLFGFKVWAFLEALNS